ncbi:MAG: hypothetical protein H6923_00650 [Alphaproteobacteria bacterium]|nr:hypothetical protein [Alphaproteobacteria bacterium]
MGREPSAEHDDGEGGGEGREERRKIADAPFAAVEAQPLGNPGPKPGEIDARPTILLSMRDLCLLGRRAGRRDRALSGNRVRAAGSLRDRS